MSFVNVIQVSKRPRPQYSIGNGSITHQLNTIIDISLKFAREMKRKETTHRSRQFTIISTIPAATTEKHTMKSLRYLILSPNAWQGKNFSNISINKYIYSTRCGPHRANCVIDALNCAIKVKRCVFDVWFRRFCMSICVTYTLRLLCSN